MRIISGTFKGKVLIAPKQLPVRPTTDFAKTGIFNILANHVDFEEISVLDLFCGTGNISYEFASRGCSKLVAVDEDFHCTKFVSETFKKLGMTAPRVIRADVFRFLESCSNTFDVIFADPPYELSTTDRIPDLVLSKKLLNENGWLIVEHQSKRKLESAVPCDEVRKYGNCVFSIFRNRAGQRESDS